MIATGEAHSVRECCEVAFDEAGLGDFEQYVTIDPAFVRPAEVDHLIGDPGQGRARSRLEAADLLRAADPADDARGPGAARAGAERHGGGAVRHLDAAGAAARGAARGDRARARLRALHPRPRGAGVRAASSPRYCGAAHGVGVANGTDAITIALRAMGVGPGRRGGRAVVHLLRLRRGDPADRREAGVLRHRPRDLLRDRRDRARGAHAAHEGRDRRAPVRQRRADRRDRGARRAGARGRRPGRRLALGGRAPGRARDGGDVLVLPVQEPRLLRRRRHDHDRPTRQLAERARTLRFHGSHDKVTYEQVGYNSRLDELQAAILRVQLPHLDGWADGRRARRRATTSRPGSASSSTLPRRRRRARRPRGTCTSSATRRSSAWKARCARAEIGHKAYYRTPVHRQAAMRAWGAGVELPGDRAGRAHAPGDPDEPGAHARAGRRGRRRRCAR